MTFEEVMGHLEELGSEQTKKTFLRHGAQEPFFGVKVGDLKKLVKYVKKDRDLALALYESGNTDAMYLAGLSINPKTMTKEELQNWAERAYWYMLAEYTVAGVAAESRYALDMAREWLLSSDELLATCGWSTYTNYISITPDEQLDLHEIAGLLEQVRTTIHAERNRVKYAMNNFVIAVGSYCHPLFDTAVDVAKEIGKVHVDVGQTACKVPLAAAYIHKVESMDRVGKKKKTCIC
ncbi:DNA alkylation repair protein [Paenibacillus aceris]|uniref:3-methyladenine DNA glycosylase AlkD n=1 Tax=Paenibacillus aceris TaxID=869555 RepID=A0ABS4HV12_9BACL|nr:DNA alkylation repair protein [Paenibacillus aceris]MBP1962477.1 3-methyladenine DNA glycosylase AlkD [Paenibacillus aceris]NHW37291.1 DNA alkylation repair protein [Paenibacillus aceris]